MSINISASILNVDFNNLEQVIKNLKDNNVKYVHLDVMDGVFVKNISFGVPIIKSIYKIKSDLIFDTHLMIVDPIRYIKEFREAGSDIITFHYEATNDIDGTIRAIKESGAKVGLSIKPDTDEKDIYKYLKDIDLLLVMSVYPGFGGQKFIENSIEKIRNIKQEIDKNHYQVTIEVDGGITNENIKKVYDAGANLVVTGRYLFDGDMKDNINKIYKEIV